MSDGDDTTIGPPKMHAQADNSVLDPVLYPADSYVDRVYWADLPGRRRSAWLSRQCNDEARREVGVIWRMFKADPLEPIRAFGRVSTLPGLGLFTEGATLFSVGNLASLFAAVWPECWGSSPSVCNAQSIKAVSYLSVVGIICGQILVGFIGDYLGRRFGLIQDAVVMLTGLLMLAVSWGASLQGWVAMYTVALFWYGLGVGGEYPLTAATALERKGTRRDDRMHRGRTVQLAFLNQGLGQLFDQAVLILALLIFNGGSQAPYGLVATQATFRLQFALIAAVVLYITYYRIYKLRGADAKLAASKGVTGYDTQSFRLTCSHYWHRLVGTSLCWLCTDFFVYGQRLFQSRFISVITGKTGADAVFENWLWNGVNILVSLAGYFLAALLLDQKWLGRKRLQLLGFTSVWILFLAAAADYASLSTINIHAFQAVYFLSSFFSQFGANATTYLLASELYPAAIRASASGFSAAVGKLGALIASVALQYVDSQTSFYVTAFIALAGALLTLAFTADTTGLDLSEQERYWRYVRRGDASRYHGVAVHPRHVSMWERYVLHRHKAYDPALDAAARLQELGTQYDDYVAAQESGKVAERAAGERSSSESDEKRRAAETIDIEDEPFEDAGVRAYFAKRRTEKPSPQPSERGISEVERQRNMHSLYNEMRHS